MQIISQDPPVNLFDAVMAQPRVAYLNRTRTGYQLTLVARPCNGAEFMAGEKIEVAGKREANSICKARGATPWNF